MNRLHLAFVNTQDISLNISFINAQLLSAFKFLSEHAVNIWNSLPNVIDSDSFYKFKCSIKRVDFSQYLRYCI